MAPVGRAAVAPPQMRPPQMMPGPPAGMMQGNKTTDLFTLLLLYYFSVFPRII